MRQAARAGLGQGAGPDAAEVAVGLLAQPTVGASEIVLLVVRIGLYVFTSHFFWKPAEAAATAATTGESGQMYGFSGY